VFHCILQPLDEVLILSPQWLFIKGLVRAARGIPIEVPFFHTSSADGTTARVRDVVAPRVTPRTRAIYFNSPNNPTGAALTPEQREDLLKVAEDHSLWVISDNAYEYYDFSPSGFVDQAFGDAGGSRTFSAYSLSKSYGLTGYRIGYLVSPTEIAERVRQFALYSIYSVPTCCQFAALSALAHGGAAIERHRRFIREAIAITTGELRVPATLPDGGFYTLLDLSRWPASVDDFIGRCIAEGVSLAPGSAFGDRCSGHARLCFSVVDHEDLAQGIHVINRVYESRARG